MAVTVPTRTSGSIGTTKSDAVASTNEPTELLADQYNTLADTVIATATLANVNEADVNTNAGVITANINLLTGHENRISALESMAGGYAKPTNDASTPFLWYGNGANTEENGVTMGIDGSPLFVAGYDGGSLASLAGSVGGGSGYKETGSNVGVLLGEMSAFCLVNPQGTQPANPYMFCCVDDIQGATSADNIAWALLMNSGLLAYQHEHGAKTSVLSNATGFTIRDGAWSHIGFTRSSGGDIKIYLNRQLVRTVAPQTLPTDAAGAVVRIGTSLGGGNFNGLIQDCVVKDFELSAAQVLAL